MPRPGASHCTLDVNSVGELRSSERLISWIQRVDDFEPPLQDQTESVRPNTPSQNGSQEKRPSTPESKIFAQSDTRRVVLSRSRYCESPGKAESGHDQEMGTKSVITLSRSHTLSVRPKTPRRPASPYLDKEASVSSTSPSSPNPPPKKSKARGHTRTPTRRTKKQPIDDDSPVGEPRNLIPPQSLGSPSPTHSQPPSPSLLYRRVKQRVLLIPAPGPSVRWIDDNASIPPSVVAQVDLEPKSKPEDDNFEDELEVLREQEEEERRLRGPIRGNSRTSAQKTKLDLAAQVKNGPTGNLEEYLDDQLEALLIQEQEEGCLADDIEALLIRDQEEEDSKGRIVLVPRREEEFRQLQPSTAPSSPRPPDDGRGCTSSLYEIWSGALEAYYLDNPATPHRHKTPIPATELLTQIEILDKAGKLLSPILPQDGPPCMICNQPTTFGRVSASNPNGNAHRPFYKCKKCDKFVTWTDLGGVMADNPACDCVAGADAGAGRQAAAVLPSRMNITGKRAASGPGRVFYTCSEARCDFWAWGAGDEPGPAKGEGLRHKGRW